jgi:hypothetical protein
MTWKPFFPDTSVWMTKSMVRASYESQTTWIFIRRLLLTCKLIVTCSMKCTDDGNTDLGMWQSGALERTF